MRKVPFCLVPLFLLGVAWLMAQRIAADKKRTLTTGNPIYSMAFRDRNTLLIGSEYSYALWDVRRKILVSRASVDTGIPLGPFFDSSVNISEDGTEFWQIGQDELKNSISLYDQPTRKSGLLHRVTFSVPQRLGTVRSALPFAHNMLLAVSGLTEGKGESVISIWNARTGRMLRTLHSSPSAYAQSWTGSPNGGLLATGTSLAQIQIYDTRTGTLRKVLRGHGNSVVALKFSPDSRQLVGIVDGFAASDKTYPATLQIWDLKSGVSTTLPNQNAENITALEFSRQGSLLAIGHADGKLDVWNLKHYQLLLRTGAHSNTITNLAFTPDDTLLATGEENGKVKLWPLE